MAVCASSMQSFLPLLQETAYTRVSQLWISGSCSENAYSLALPKEANLANSGMAILVGLFLFRGEGLKASAGAPFSSSFACVLPACSQFSLCFASEGEPRHCKLVVVVALFDGNVLLNGEFLFLCRKMSVKAGLDGAGEEERR